MKTEVLSFQNRGGDVLAALLDLPEGESAGVGEAPKAFALFAHCFTCSKDLTAVSHISRALTDAGIAVLRFDFTGLGGSAGEFADTSFSTNTDDLVAAAEFMAARGQAPEILIGHSLGGAAVLYSAARIASARAVVTVGAPCKPQHIAHLISGSRDAIESAGQAEVTLGSRKFWIKKQFLDDLAEFDDTAAIRRLGKALLVMHSPHDEVVPIDNAAHIYASALHPKSFISLDSADHLLTERADACYVGSVIAAWVERYLDEAPAGQPAVAPTETGVVVFTGASGYRSEIVAGHHRFVADEPASVGGADQGPAPHELLAASLGACTGMTLRMYADRKEWPLEGVRVRLTHGTINASDCPDCETKTGKIYRIQREIELLGPLTDEQRARCLAIADRCPVHRTLRSEIHIVSSLREPADARDE